MSDSSSSTVVGPSTSYPPQTAKPVDSYSLKERPWHPRSTPFERILNEEYPGSGTEADPYIIEWLENDPEDPQRWNGGRKWFTIGLVSITTLAVALASSAYSGGIPDMIEDLGASSELLTAGISLFVVGFAFGPLFWAPLSELYGRRNTFIVSYFFLTIWLMAVALSKTVAQVLVFRFLAGFFGSSPLANAGGVISDVLDANQRGLGMALFAAAPFLGPALGPITGGFLGLTSGWKWVAGFLTIFAGVIFFTLLLFCPESYAPTILRSRAATLSKATGKVYRFRADAKGVLSLGPLFKTALLRPWKFLIYEPIVIILTIYTAVLYGILYLNFAAYPIIFQQLRGWNTGIGGLAFLGILVGTILSVVVSIAYIQPQYLKVAKAKGGFATPEDRLPSSIWGGIFIVIGLAGFAATDGPDVHWVAPIIFGIPFGFGVIVSFLAILGYLVDSYTIYAASVLAANSVLRSLFGAAFPLFTSYMYKGLGIHWAAALPGFIALACVPFTWIFYKYGAQIRAKCKYASDAERQMKAIMAARNKHAKKGDPEKHAESPNAPSTAENQQKDTDGGEGGDAGLAGRPSVKRQASSVMSRQEREEMAELRRTSSHNAAPMDSGHRHEHEWSMYEALADRDEVDLDDDERLHLQELHERFNHQKAKNRPRSRSRPASPTATFRPQLPSAAEERVEVGNHSTTAPVVLEKPVN